MTLPYTPGTPVRLVSPYGRRTDPITGMAGVPHNGIDLVGDGDKRIRAVTGGYVLQSRIVYDESNPTSEWGNYISIKGDDGYVYYYCHLSTRWVKSGEYVEAGQIIGAEGSTGRSTESHLHFEVRKDVVGAAVDPAEVLGIPNVNGTYTEKEESVVEEEKKSKKTDSEPQEWSKAAVEWAVENGIIYGDGNGDLMLREPCTREQMLVFLYRMLQILQGG